MRLRLFERVRRLAHPRAGRLMPRRDRAGETARPDRPWEARSGGRFAGGRGESPSVSSEAAGRHRRSSQQAAGLTGRDVTASRPGPAWTDQTGPPWPDERRSAPPPAGPGSAAGGPPDGGRPDRRPPGVSPPAGGEAAARTGGEAPAAPVGGARARVRSGPFGTAPVAPPAVAPAARRGSRRGHGGASTPGADARQRWPGAQRGYLPAQRPASAAQRPAGAGAVRPRLPFAGAHNPGAPSHGDGRRNCGTLEAVLWRQWDPATIPPAAAAAAIDRLADLPQQIKDRLAAGLDGIFVGPGGVPQLDDMTALRGVPLPSGRSTWDACAGAYGERKIVVGTRPSPTPDVMCHEVGHALDDIDAPAGRWQSDSAEFRMLYDQCQPHLASDFHRQRGGLGRKEFFADAFAAIASRQRPALVDMLGGNTRTALNVMLYFNRRYGI
jgi:hypothetical protein